MANISQATRDHLIRTGLACCRAAGDHDELLRTAHSFRYWSLRLELNDPGPVDEELASMAEPDLVALRCLIRQDGRVLRGPLGDWKLKAAMLLERTGVAPALADMTAQGAALLAAEPAAHRPPRRLVDLWSAGPRTPLVQSKRLDGHSRPVTQCVMYNGQPRLATTDGSEVLIWDVELGRLQAIISGGDGAEVVSCYFYEPGGWLATVQIQGGQPAQTYERSILRVWDLGGSAPPRPLHGPMDNAYDCEVSSDGRWLVEHYCDHKAVFWDTRDWTRAGEIIGQADSIYVGVTAASCYARDGSWFALANANGTIGLWDPATRAQLHLLSGSRGQAVTLAAPRNSSWLASLDKFGIRIWDTRRGVLIRSVPAPSGGLAGLIADPRGRWVAAAFGPDNVRVIAVHANGRQRALGRRAADVITRRLPPSFSPGPWDFGGARCRAYQHGDRIASLTVYESTSHHGEMIHSRYEFSTWDASTGARIAGPTSLPGQLPQLAVDEAGEWAAALSDTSESHVDLLATATGAVLGEFEYGRDRLRTATVGQGRLVTGHESGAVRLYQPGRTAPVRTVPLTRAPGGLRGCHVPPHGRWVLAWYDRTVILVDPRSGSVRARLAGQETGVFVNGLQGLCAFSPDGAWVATIDDDWSIRVWDPDTAQQLARISTTQAERFAPGPCAATNCMVTIDGDGLLRVRDGRAFMRSELPGHGAGRVSHVFLAGHLELVAEDKSGLHVWDLRSGRRLYDLPGEYGAAPLERSGWFPDGGIVTLGQDGQIRFRESAGGRPWAALDGAPAGSGAAGNRVQAMHPAGEWVAMADDRGTITVGVRQTGDVRLVSGGAGDKVTACAASPDGSMLATARQSGVLVVWDTTTWQQLATADSEGTLAGVAWSPSGDRIYATGGSGALCYDTTACGHADGQVVSST